MLLNCDKTVLLNVSITSHARFPKNVPQLFESHWEIVKSGVPANFSNSNEFIEDQRGDEPLRPRGFGWRFKGRSRNLPFPIAHRCNELAVLHAMNDRAEGALFEGPYD